MPRLYVRSDPKLSPEDRRREVQRRHRASHQEQRAEYNRQWRAKNFAAAQKREQEYYLANKAQFREHSRRYDDRHREERAAARRARHAAAPEKDREWGQRRRARQRKAFVAAVDCREVYDRCRGRCHICGGSVRWETPYPDPLSKSLDHVTPLSRGGTHEPGNVRLAHLRCNVVKGSRVTVGWHQAGPYTSARERPRSEVTVRAASTGTPRSGSPWSS